MNKLIPILFLLLIPVRSHAAIALVQQKVDVTCGSISCMSKGVTFTSNVKPGHFIGVLANFCNNGGCTLVSPISVAVTDSNGVTYSCPVDDDNSTASHAVICYTYNVAGGSTTVTITATGGPMNYLRMWIVEFSGVATAFDPLDQTNIQDYGGSGSTTVASTANPTAMAGELMLSLSNNFFATVTSVAAPAVELSVNSGSTDIVPQSAYTISHAIETASITFNLSGSVITRHSISAMFCPPLKCGTPASMLHKSQVY